MDSDDMSAWADGEYIFGDEDERRQRHLDKCRQAIREAIDQFDLAEEPDDDAD